MKDRVKEVNRCIELVKSERSRDAVGELHSLVGAPIRYIARKFFRNPEDVDDLVQDFWADIFEIVDGYKYTLNGLNYLCIVMRNRAINAYNLRAANRERCETFIPECGYEKIDEIEVTNKMEAKYLVEKGLAKLDDRQKEVLFEIYYLQKTDREIAKDMNVSKSLINKVKQKALDIICDEIISINKRGQNG